MFCIRSMGPGAETYSEPSMRHFVFFVGQTDGEWLSAEGKGKKWRRGGRGNKPNASYIKGAKPLCQLWGWGVSG